MVKNLMAYEEANYQVVQQFNEFEIRYYQERYVIQVSYANQNSGFQKLFNYISGQNNQSQKIEMTTSIQKTLTPTSPSTRAIPPTVTSAFLLSFRPRPRRLSLPMTDWTTTVSGLPSRSSKGMSPP